METGGSAARTPRDGGRRGPSEGRPQYFTCSADAPWLTQPAGVCRALAQAGSGLAGSPLGSPRGPRPRQMWPPVGLAYLYVYAVYTVYNVVCVFA